MPAPPEPDADSLPPPAAECTWQAGWPIDLGLVLGPLMRGRRDPSVRRLGTGIVRATATPEGPATIWYQSPRPGWVVARCWGPGARWEASVTPTVLGAQDDPAGFDWSAHPLTARARDRVGQAWRAPRTGRTWEALAPAILEQRVTGRQAREAWHLLVTHYGTPAPGPGPQWGLVVPPQAPTWARIPTWAYHRAGVDPARMRTLVAAAGHAGALERLADRPPDSAREALESLPGIGTWTSAEVAIRAWGDRDAVSFGDFHLAALVVHSLTGMRAGTDAQMAELLAPWAGQRARAVRMIELLGSPPERRGPRATIPDHRGR